MIEINDKIFGAPHFTWREALLLREWYFCAYPDPEIKKNIEEVAQKLETIRTMFREKIFIKSWYRPMPYNKLIGGALRSAHIHGMAVDFVVDNMTCDEVREELIPELDRLDIRLEDLPRSNWVHIDIRKPGFFGRYFIN